ncbi:MAG: DUF5074 domain-containing protein [Chitinophagaceae bacterium]
MKTVKILFSVLSASLLLVSCDKDDIKLPDNPKVTTGVFALSEGSVSFPSTTLSFYNFTGATTSTDFYFNANGSSLGTLGNDMIVYGSKMYIVVTVDSYVEVADAKTAKHISSIPFEKTAGGNREPRYAVPYKNTVLVSSWDGTVAVIDTATLNITKFITVGTNPEQMVVAGDKLYVTNSGGLLPGIDKDSTVSVVNLLTLAETARIKVGLNPCFITADDNGFIYVGTIGNYVDAGAKLFRINTANNTVVKSADTAVGKMVFHDGLLYATGGYFGSPHVRTLNPSDFSQTRANFVTDGTSIATPYGITIDPANGDVYVTDAKNYITGGEVICFDKTGKRRFSFSTAPGTSPNTVALVK